MSEQPIALFIILWCEGLWRVLDINVSLLFHVEYQNPNS